MSERAAHLVDRVLPRVPYRQFVLTLPGDLCRVVAFDSSLSTAVFTIFADVIQGWYRAQADARGVLSPHAGCVLEIQRHADAATLYPHAHALVPEGVFYETDDGKVRFQRTRVPQDADVAAIVDRVAERVRRLLKRRGLIGADPPEDAGAGAQSAQRQLLLQCASASPSGRHTMAGHDKRPPSSRRRRKPLCASSSGFEVHAAVHVAAADRTGLERLCKYISRPPVPQDRVSLDADGRVRFELKRAWKGGVWALTFGAVAFIARLAALVPPPGGHLSRFYGVFGGHHSLRSRIVPRPPDPSRAKRPVAPKRPAKMAWSELMARTWGIEVLRCPRCAGPMRFISAVMNPSAVDALVAALIDSPRPG
jgi:putative transposase